MNEEVLQSAVEVAKAEVLLTGHHAKQHQKHADFGLMQRVQEKATRFVLLEPLKASLLAAGSGAVLALLLEQGLKRLFRVVR